MMSKSLQRARRIVATVRLFDNWPSVYWRKFSRNGGTQILRLRNNLQFEVAETDAHSLPIIAEVFYKGVYRDGLSVASPDPVVIDIGGNIGASAVFFLKELPTATVYAFEPEPATFDLLRKNIALNGFAARGKGINKAVAGSAGTRTLFFAPDSGTNSLVVQDDRGQIAVECTTLEQIFAEHHIERCDLLKIDCEGAEYEILLDTPAAVLNRVSTIILEWHSIPGHSPQELEQYLGAAGYSTRRMATARILVAQKRPAA